MARIRKRWWWLIGAVAAVLVVVVGVPFVYTRFISGDAPDPLSLTTKEEAGPAGQSAAGPPGTSAPFTPTLAQSSSSDSSHSSDDSHPSDQAASASSRGAGQATGTAVDGTWHVGEGSLVGYRVNEVLFGQSTTAVGRTGSVSGQLDIAGTQVTSGGFTVDMTTVKSDRSQRDGQFNGRIMSTATFPTATFSLTQPIQLGQIPGDQQPLTATATGDLTLRGVTRTVTIDVKAQRNGDKVEVNGSFPVTFADWQIPNPSLGPVSTEDHGVLELLLVLTR